MTTMLLPLAAGGVYASSFSTDSSGADVAGGVVYLVASTRPPDSRREFGCPIPATAGPSSAVFLVGVSPPEALVEAGVLAGLPRPTANALVIQTVLGSARLLAETGKTAEEHRAAVTSPGGTTAAGLRALESRGVRSAFIEAVWDATKRSKELGQG